MAKPVLYYALTRKWNYATGRSWSVLAVTSEKGRQVYGRDEHDAATHCRAGDVLYRFPPGTPLEFAKAAGDRATREEARHAEGIEAARRKLADLQRDRDLAVLDAAKGLDANPAVAK